MEKIICKKCKKQMMQDAQGTIKCIYCGYNPVKEIIDDFKEKCYLQHMDGETRVVMEVEKFNQFVKEHLGEKH